MIELEPTSETPEMIDYGYTKHVASCEDPETCSCPRKVIFQLPVLGSKGVPLGLMTAFSMFWEKYQSGRSLTDREVSSAWNFLIQTLADTYPDATRQIAMLDSDNITRTLTKWVSESNKHGFDAGKA